MSEELAYIAGLFDGEGSISVYPEKERNRVNVLAQEIKQLNHGGLNVRL